MERFLSILVVAVTVALLNTDLANGKSCQNFTKYNKGRLFI